MKVVSSNRVIEITTANTLQEIKHIWFSQRNLCLSECHFCSSFHIDWWYHQDLTIKHSVFSEHKISRLCLLQFSVIIVHIVCDVRWLLFQSSTFFGLNIMIGGDSVIYYFKTLSYIRVIFFFCKKQSSRLFARL